VTGDKSPLAEPSQGEERVDSKLDLLVGAEAIAIYMFGDPTETRRVYHAWEAHGLPAFKVGNALWARKSALRSWVQDKEQDSVRAPKPPMR
jgi:hypothetical protein